MSVPKVSTSVCCRSIIIDINRDLPMRISVYKICVNNIINRIPLLTCANVIYRSIYFDHVRKKQKQKILKELVK